MRRVSLLWGTVNIILKAKHCTIPTNVWYRSRSEHVQFKYRIVFTYLSFPYVMALRYDEKWVKRINRSAQIESKETLSRKKDGSDWRCGGRRSRRGNCFARVRTRRTRRGRRIAYIHSADERRDELIVGRMTSCAVQTRIGRAPVDLRERLELREDLSNTSLRQLRDADEMKLVFAYVCSSSNCTRNQMQIAWKTRESIYCTVQYII